MPKRPLGIETLERRCPMDASAAIVDFDAEPVLGNAPPIALPPVPAITATLEGSPRLQGADQRPLPLHQNPNQMKTFTAARRVALAKRPLVVDPLQQPSLSGSVITDGFDDYAAVIGGDSQLPLPLPTVPPTPSLRDEPSGPREADKQPEPITDVIDSPSKAGDLGSQVEDPITAEEPPLDFGSGKAGTEITGEPPERTTTDPPVSRSEEPTDPLAPTDPLESGEPDCPAIQLDPIRFLSPPGPAGSIGLVPPGRASVDYWASASAETDLDAEPGVITGSTSVRPARSLRGDPTLSQSRYYESSEDGREQPADAFRSRPTPLRAFARQSEPLDNGIAIGATTGTPADDAALTHWKSRSTNIEAEADSEEDATASYERQTDLAIAALVEEAAQAEQAASDMAESGIIATAVGLVRHEQNESVQTCSRDCGDDAVVVALSPAQDFMINLSRWAALGLLVSHRLAHQVACRGGLLSWMSGLRDRLVGGRSRRY